jgi:hypothetical protein
MRRRFISSVLFNVRGGDGFSTMDAAVEEVMFELRGTTSSDLRVSSRRIDSRRRGRYYIFL